MVKMKPFDPNFPIQQQLARHDPGLVVLVNLFTLDAADEGAFVDAFSEDAAYMKARPGYISTQLHRAVGDNPTYFNYAVWESLDLFRAAFSDPAFRARLDSYPSSVIASPHLFRRVAVPGACTT